MTPANLLGGVVSERTCYYPKMEFIISVLGFGFMWCFI